ncbi:MAG: DUF5320 domain-containing protein [Fibrobacterota bacterium]
MPRGDGTGPNGTGAGTGRRMGFCGGLNSPGCLNGKAVLGRGRGGAGRGLAWRRGFQGFGQPGPMPLTENGMSEKDALQRQISALEAQLSRIKTRLSETGK